MRPGEPQGAVEREGNYLKERMSPASAAISRRRPIPGDQNAAEPIPEMKKGTALTTKAVFTPPTSERRGSTTSDESLRCSERYGSDSYRDRRLCQYRGRCSSR